MQSLSYPQTELLVMARNPCLKAFWADYPELLTQDNWPTCADWQEQSRRAFATLPMRLNFTPDFKLGQRRRRKLAQSKPDQMRPAQRRYEATIMEAGEILTREQNLHDYFNALIWIRFPQSKFALHRRAYESYLSDQLEVGGNLRNDLTDALTRFDEGGVIYFARPSEDLLEIRGLFRSRADDRKAHFVEQRTEDFAVFGHGLLQVSCQGQRGLTAGLLMIPWAEGLNRDERLAGYLSVMNDPTGLFGTVLLDQILENTR